MTAPAVAAGRFLWACLIGAGLGLCYGFLRPLRRKRTSLADFLFVLAAFWGWLVLGFGVCRGDLRLSYTAGLFLGGFLWEITVGRLLRPVFRLFWKAIDAFFGVFLGPLKKFSNFMKILFASVEKWVTIKWSNRRHLRRASGGKPYGRTENILQSDQAGLSAHDKRGKGDDHRGYHLVYGRADHPAAFHD